MRHSTAVPSLRSTTVATLVASVALVLTACGGNGPARSATEEARGAPGAATNGVAPAAVAGSTAPEGARGTGGAMSDTLNGALPPAAGMAGPPNANGTTGGMTSGTAAATAGQRGAPGTQPRTTP